MDVLSAPPFVFIGCRLYEKALAHLWGPAEKRRKMPLHDWAGATKKTKTKKTAPPSSFLLSNNSWQAKEDGLGMGGGSKCAGFKW